MLYHLLPQLTPYLSVMNVTRYITFRTAIATITALAMSLLLGPWLIRRLRDFQVGQIIRQEGPQSHRAKAGTPTMGGLLILPSALVPTLLWADLSNVYVVATLLVTLGFGAIGFYDDYLKVTKQTDKGFSGRARLGIEFVIAGIATYFMMQASLSAGSAGSTSSPRNR